MCVPGVGLWTAALPKLPGKCRLCHMHKICGSGDAAFSTAIYNYVPKKRDHMLLSIYTLIGVGNQESERDYEV